MRKLFKKAVKSIKDNKECLAVGLIVSMIAPVIMSGLILVAGYFYG